MPIFVDPCPGAVGPGDGGRFGDCRTQGDDPCGRPHNGIDLTAAKGTPIVAANSGVLATGDRGPESAAGKWATVAGVGYASFYCHIDSFARTSGLVSQGQTIAYVGETGNARGPHLHFEINIGGITVDPQDYVRGAGDTGGSPFDGTPGLVDEEASASMLALHSQIAAMSCQQRIAWARSNGFGDALNLNELNRITGTGSVFTEGMLTDAAQTARQQIADLMDVCGAWEGSTSIERVVANVTDPLAAVGSFFAALGRGETWLRVAYVLGGALVGWQGVKWMGKVLGQTIPGPLDVGRRIGTATASRGISEIA